MRVVVVGAGLSGLFTACELLSRGVDDLVVVETGDGPGGVTRTVHRDGYSLEPGAGSFLLPHPHLSPLLARLGVETVPAAASARSVWNGHRLVAVPASPAALTTPLLPVTAKLRAALEVAVPKGDGREETLDEFLRRRLGSRAGRLAAWLAASGVFAGDPAALSAAAAFPALPGLEASHGSLLRGMLARLRSRPRGAPRPAGHVPIDGMSGVAERAADLLGDRLRTGFPVSAIRRAGAGWRVEGPETIEAERVVVSVDPVAASRLLDGTVADLLSQAVSAPVAVVGLGGRGVQVPDGFGILTGPDAGTWTRGVLLESSYAPHRAPAGHGFVKAIVGGAPSPEAVDAPDDALVDRVGSEVARILRSEINASHVEIIRHHAGIPQYGPGHLDWLREVEATTPDGIHVTGWGYRGVGVGHVAADAARIAALVAA